LSDTLTGATVSDHNNLMTFGIYHKAVTLQ